MRSSYILMCGVPAEGYMIRKIVSRHRWFRSVPLLRNALWQQRSQGITGQRTEIHSNWLRSASFHCSGCPSFFSTLSGRTKRGSSFVNKEANLSGLPAMLHNRGPKGRGSKVRAAGMQEGHAHRAGDYQSDKTSGAQQLLREHDNAPSMPKIDRPWAKR